jgi:hypothetical protein
MPTPMTRRAALAGGVSAAVALVWDAPAEAAGTMQVYVLDPNGGGASCTLDCASCLACRAHAANKLFRAGADVVRAHPGCRCTVTAGPSFPNAVHAQLFASSGAADRRTPAIAGILAAGVDQQELPMFGDVGPAVLLGAGAAGLGWVLRRRQLLQRG